MSSETPTRRLFAQFALVAKAIAHERRIEILEYLAQGECSVEALAAKLDLPVANVSHHLQQMRRGGLVAWRRDGKFIHYRLGDEAVAHFISALRTIAERQLAEVERVTRTYFRERDAMEPISRRELMRRIKEGGVTVLDVRPRDEYAKDHLPGAVNVPLGELKRGMRTLDRGREVIAYCRGPYCILAFEAVAALRARGFKVRRLEDGFPEWKMAGLPTAAAQRAASGKKERTAARLA